MTTPCTQENMIKEIRDDVKLLLDFRSRALGIIVATCSFFTFIGFILTTIITIFLKK